MSPYSRIRIWCPTPRQLRRTLWVEVASTLSSAFSSQGWEATPMPVGDATDPNSALGIMAELCTEGPTVLASTEGNAARGAEVLGCVLGGVLNDSLIERFGLRPYGACRGDGLLAFIGVAPTVQGARGYLRTGNVIEDLGPSSSRPPVGSVSLASALFSNWLALPAISSRRAVFIRTREVIRPILHLAGKHGFVYQGRMHQDFRGSIQERLVFRRDNPHRQDA